MMTISCRRGLYLCVAWLVLVGVTGGLGIGPPAGEPQGRAPALTADAAQVSADPESLFLSALGAAWRDARLAEAGSADQARITAFARRYGIGRQLSSQIYEAARSEGVHPALAFSLVRVESGFDPRALSAFGAIGLTQIKPRTARELVPGVSHADLYSTRLNLTLGFRYLRHLLDRFDQNVVVALAAYNRGPTRVERQLARGKSPRSAFARKILRNIDPRVAAQL